MLYLAGKTKISWKRQREMNGKLTMKNCHVNHSSIHRCPCQWSYSQYATIKESLYKREASQINLSLTCTLSLVPIPIIKGPRDRLWVIKNRCDLVFLLPILSTEHLWKRTMREYVTGKSGRECFFKKKSVCDRVVHHSELNWKYLLNSNSISWTGFQLR